MLITFISWLSKTILRIMARYEKHQSRPQEIYSSAINMMIISFINTAIVILLVNFNIGYVLPLPILQGSYKEFTVEWYRLVGSTICVTMLMMIVTPHGANGVF